MTPQNKTRRRRGTEALVTTAIGTAVAGYLAFQSTHNRSTDGRTLEIVWVVLGGIYLVSGLIRFLQRNKRNPFEEEMAHRRNLVRNDENLSRVKVKN